MKALMCEICHSTEFVKDGGVFVCQSCGTKYSLDEAKKMMIDGAVEVTGTVKIDSSSELTNLYEIARRAKDTNNSENALRYYDMILVKDPRSWEANFYVVFFRAMSCKIAQIHGAAISVSNCIPSTLTLVKTDIVEEEERKRIVDELYVRTSQISQMLYNGAKNHYDGIDIQVRDRFTQEYLYNVASSRDIMYNFGNYLIETFGDIYGTISAEAWKQGIRMHTGFIKLLQDKETNKSTIEQYGEKIKKYDAAYQTPLVDTSSGPCYIATAVYGSYDCPEVWVLRRFRDNILARTWCGTIFIQTYYRVSPAFVRWCGGTKWFKNGWRILLNKLVNALHTAGIAKTPYQDN
jgi:hypothetical protein